ncbi:hypothetical protein FS837_012794 [Tulasnella sp. UAMH 9824]|nr:hypothetical protein FS837_012794 [Tulasnella sp. UAMH 9824]
MESPGRILDMGSYAYKESTGLEAQVTKPQAVVEAEFRLSDDLFPLGQITGGPKGDKIYQEILTSFVPSARAGSTFEEIIPDQAIRLMAHYQNLIMNWLLELVPNWVAPNEDILKDIPEKWAEHIPKQQDKAPKPDITPPEKISRVDLFQKLLSIYEDSRLRWQQLKLQARPQKPADDSEWDLYDRTLATFSPSIDAKLEALWSVVLVKGQYHRVRHYLGLLDVESPAEALLRAKEALRASKMRSVDDSEDIYPVQLSPASWGNYLTTDFEPVDLFLEDTSIIEELTRAQNQRNELIRQLSVLESSKQDVTTIEKEKAKEEMLKGFTENAATFVEFYIAKIPKVGDLVTKKMQTEAQTKWKLTLSQEEITRIERGLENVIAQRNGYDGAMNKYARIIGQVASAEASNPELAISQLKTQIEALSSSINTYSRNLQGLPSGSTGNSTPESKPNGSPGNPTQGTDSAGGDDHPQGSNSLGGGSSATQQPTDNAKSQDVNAPKAKKGASQWQSIVVKCSIQESSDKTETLQSSSKVQVQTHGWFHSAQYDKESSAATSLKQASSKISSIDLAMNVMKVQISRPWLDASIFKKSSGYNRISGKSFSTKFDTTLLSTLGPKDLGEKFARVEDDSLLPAYPIAFLVAKDVTIKFHSDSQTVNSLNSVMKDSMNAGGACLGFSVAAAGQSSGNMQSAYSQAKDTSITMKIPGPQIIGWIMQCTPEDKSSTDYKHINADQFQIGNNANAEPNKSGSERK